MNTLEFIENGTKTLKNIVNMFMEKPSLRITELTSDKSALIIVDMVNGFAREGALQSPRVEAIIPEIALLSQKCEKAGIPKLAFADAHSNSSPEFEAYPTHCLEGTSESEIVDELKEIGGYQLILKNSTNGFLEEAFQKWLEEHPLADNFIIVGDCTDICIQQFALTLKTWFNKQDRKARIIVPMNAVDTYDFDLHNGDLLQVMALYTMHLNGIEIVKSIE